MANGERARSRPAAARRPRDELGRPLAWGAEDRLALPDLDAMTADENHRYALDAFEGGRYFPAHEAWETAWKACKGTPDEEFFKGMAQLGAGYVHVLRGNAHGAEVLLGRAASRIGAYPSPHRGIDAADLTKRCLADAAAVRAGTLVPGPTALANDPPRVRSVPGV
jgi:hypothetical protein